MQVGSSAHYPAAVQLQWYPTREQPHMHTPLRDQWLAYIEGVLQTVTSPNKETIVNTGVAQGATLEIFHRDQSRECQVYS